MSNPLEAWYSYERNNNYTFFNDDYLLLIANNQQHILLLLGKFNCKICDHIRK